jgi:hypothetical protein
MSDIYKHKSRKYKLKYLKLKKELEDLEGGGFFDFLKSNKGISFNKLNKNRINNDNFKIILINLRKLIDTYIRYLQSKGEVLNNINLQNMNLDDNNELYFNDTKKHHYTNKDQIKIFDREDKDNFYFYPKFLKCFLSIREKHLSVSDIINKFKDQSVKDRCSYNESIIKHIFYNESLNTIYNIDDFYNKYFSNMAYNIDIYALYTFIYKIYHHFKIKFGYNVLNLIENMKIKTDYNFNLNINELLSDIDKIIQMI